MKLEYIVKKEDANTKLKYILKNKLHISTSLLKKLKLNNSIFVNDCLKNVDVTLKENDKILVVLDDKTETNNIAIYSKELDIVYEDKYLIIVNKPYNLEVHPCLNNYDKTLANMLMYYYTKQNYIINKVHILTRLDKDTSGLCVIAKHEYVQNLFDLKKDYIKLKKEYIAIADGIVQNEHGIIERNIARKENSIILREVNELGNYAKTEYYVLDTNIQNNYTVLKVILHTGRTHQIRVHLASIGHVLLGDDLYGIEYNKNDICRLIKRQALHCSKISFIHPITNEEITVIADIPEDMKELVKNIK